MTAATTAPDPAHSTDDVPFAVQDRRRKGFFTIDNELYDRFGSELGPYGLAVYMGLARFANQESECFPSQTTLAKRSGMSRMQVSREIAKLQTLGLIAIDHQFGSSGQKRSNLYVLLDLPHVTEGDIPCNTELHPHVTDSDTPCNGQLQQNNTNKNKTQRQQDIGQHRRPRRQRSPASTNVPDDKNDVVVVLSNLGISDSVALNLATRYSRERIEEKLAYLEFVQADDPEQVKKPACWLRSAIEADWSAPAGFMTQEEHERQKAAEAQKAQAEAEQVRIIEEARQSFQEKKKADQAAFRQALAEKYGTTDEDLAFWEQAQYEIKYTTPAHIAHLVADVDILKVTDETVVVGVERADVWRQLQHPNIQKAINRALGCVAGRDMSISPVEI